MPGSRNLLVYAESLLPADRHSRLQSDSAFSSLYYALYLGTRARQSDLLVSDTPTLQVLTPSRPPTSSSVNIGFVIPHSESVIQSSKQACCLATEPCVVEDRISLQHFEIVKVLRRKEVLG